MLMSYPVTQQVIHEIVGIMMFLGFILHHFLNRKWYKTMLNGKYPVIKKIFIGVNFLLFIDIILIFISGLTLSELFPFLNFMSASIARKLHMIFSYWGFILMSVHLGLHIQGIMISFKKIIRKKSLILNKVIAIISLFGILIFIKNQWISYLLLLNEFVYYEESTNMIKMIFEHLSVLVLFVFLTYLIHINFIQAKRKEEKEKL